jgi:hypothetical protein
METPLPTLRPIPGVDGIWSSGASDPDRELDLYRRVNAPEHERYFARYRDCRGLLVEVYAATPSRALVEVLHGIDLEERRLRMLYAVAAYSEAS